MFSASSPKEEATQATSADKEVNSAGLNQITAEAESQNNETLRHEHLRGVENRKHS